MVERLEKEEGDQATEGNTDYVSATEADDDIDDYFDSFDVPKAFPFPSSLSPLSLFFLTCSLALDALKKNETNNDIDDYFDSFDAPKAPPKT